MRVFSLWNSLSDLIIRKTILVALETHNILDALQLTLEISLVDLKTIRVNSLTGDAAANLPNPCNDEHLELV